MQVPHDLVIPMSDVGAFLALVTVLVGFAYLLFGVQVFRLITTMHASVAGMIVGAIFGFLIDSVPVGMLLGAAALGSATWFYTRWTMALLVGLVAAAGGWAFAVTVDANAIGAFFVALAAAVTFGAPVLLFYRWIVIGYTSLSGGTMVVSGSAAAIVLIRYHLLPDLHQSSGHAFVGLICTLLLAVPAFFFQAIRYGSPAESANPAASSDEPAFAARRAA